MKESTKERNNVNSPHYTHPRPIFVNEVRQPEKIVTPIVALTNVTDASPDKNKTANTNSTQAAKGATDDKKGNSKSSDENKKVDDGKK